MWFGFQFNLSDSSDDNLYRLDLDPEGQGHQWKTISIYSWDHILKVKVTSGKLSLYSWDHILVHPKKKSSRGCLRVRPDADTDVKCSKTIC